MDQGPAGSTGHTGSDKSEPEDRIGRYVHKILGKSAENLDYGHRRGLEVILSLLVDDGDLWKGHRALMMSPDVVYVGIYSGDHNEFGKMAAFKYTGPVLITNESLNPTLDP